MLTPVVHISQLADGDMVVVRVGDHDILVGMTEGQYFALSAHCTHARQSLVSGRLRGFEVSCPLHGGRFDVRTGACTKAPVSEPLQRFPVVLEGGKVCIEV